MYYTVAISGPTPVSVAPTKILGVPADSAVRIAAPVVMGVLSAVGLIYSLRGKEHVAAAMALTGLLLSSFVAAGQAIVYEEERGRL